MDTRGFVLYHMHYMFPQNLQAEEGYSVMHRSAVGRRKLTVCVKGHSRKIDSDTCVFGWVGGGWVRFTSLSPSEPFDAFDIVDLVVFRFLFRATHLFILSSTFYISVLPRRIPFLRSGYISRGKREIGNNN